MGNEQQQAYKSIDSLTLLPKICPKCNIPSVYYLEVVDEGLWLSSCDHFLSLKTPYNGL